MLAENPVFTSLTVLSIAVLISACSSDSTTDTPTPEAASATLVWSACEGSETLQCASLKVPVDYTQPDADSLEIALARLPASGAQSEGSIVFNPGGPGGSGLAMVAELEQIGMPADITERFDLVGFDPRGVGGSRAVACNDMGEDDINDYPLTLDDIRELEQQRTAYATACYQKYGDYLLHLGSNNVARDMDKIRAALGESTLRFIGYSYGTRLASLYAQLFPMNVGALVLDGSMPPEGGLLKISRDGLTQVHDNLLVLLQSCTSDANPCDNTALLAQMEQRVNLLIAEEREDELSLFGELLLVAAQEPEIGEIALNALRTYVDSNDSAVLELFVEQFENVTGESLVDDDLDDNNNEDDELAVQLAVMCADDPVRPNADEIAAQLDSYNAISDMFGELYLSEAGMCMGWPASIDPLQPISATVDKGVVVIGGTSDASTPLLWSQEMAQALGSPLIVSEHSGHTVAFQQASDCVDQQVIAFFLDGTTPASVTCAIE